MNFEFGFLLYVYKISFNHTSGGNSFVATVSLITPYISGGCLLLHVYVNAINSLFAMQLPIITFIIISLRALIKKLPNLLLHFV